MIQAIIFDLDGVIVHTDKFHYAAWQKLADEEGIPFSKEVNHRLLGVSRMDSLNIVLEKAKKTYTADEKHVLAERKNDYYKAMLSTMSPKDLDQDVKETLLKLKADGIHLAIGSSSKNAPLILSLLGIADWFDAISDGNGLENAKPHPEVFLKAADALGVKPGDCIVVEDASAGIAAANAGGFISVAIGHAVNDKTAQHRINKLSDLLELV